MRVHLLTFGVLRDLLPSGGAVELPESSTVARLLEHLQNTLPHQPLPWSSMAVAVNREYVTASHALADGDEVALLPPVSGGAPDGQPVPHVALTDAPIDSAALIANIRQGEDGAVVVFDGIVRNNTRGRRTLYLDYEAYPEMALDQMKRLAAQALANYPIRDAAIVHRLGRLGIGETSVLVVVASAHRAAAFDACRWIIDTLKQTVPIWKKEYFEDGAVWAPGEPFPAALTPHPASGQEPAR